MKRPGKKTLAQKMAESAAAGVQVQPKDKSNYKPAPRPEPPPPEVFENKPFAKMLVPGGKP
jgi:hypothetical protein